MSFEEIMLSLVKSVEHLATAIENNNVDYWQTGHTGQTTPANPAPEPPAPAQAAGRDLPLTAEQPAPQPAQTPAQQPAVPTVEPAYSLEQLARAAGDLLNAGKNPGALLAQFGIQKLNQLPKEQFNAFATALRQMGARL